MLISPPFLPPRGDLTEDQWLSIAMTGGTPGAGAYPVSANLDWHGGVHLVAPMNGNTPGPVRAIADGTVVFVQEPTNTNNPKHPLYYGGGYTSDGAVVIRHDTAIGINSQEQATAVCFYSIYHHLHTIRRNVMRNRPIWRKDEIGQAGYIYGKSNQIHFEVRCDEDNLCKLIGRTSGDLPLDRNGRTDAVFGEIYYYLPNNTPIYEQCPLYNSAEARITTPSNKSISTPIQPIHRTNQAMIVGIRYAGGTGVLNRRGDAFVTSYMPDGSTIGQAFIENQAEYKLYETCTSISNSYPAASRPPPSAVMELLRFGRIIGPDALIPVDVPHWRQISHSNGTGWVNLNATNIKKFSDADFPHWKNWKMVADDGDNDARCESKTLKSWLGLDRNHEVDPIEVIATQTQDIAASRMEKTICKIPCEWNADTLESRWKWLKSTEQENHSSMDTEEYEKFIEHANALCIACPEIISKQWTINPKGFIKTFMHCNWMTSQEFAQCFPRTLLHLNNTDFVSTTTPWSTAIRKGTEWSAAFNRAARRFGIAQSRQRLLHLISHIIPETGNLTFVKEIQGENARYAPYYGRGLIQLTWLEGYKKYGAFRHFPQTLTSGTYSSLGWDPDVLIAQDNNGHHNNYNCADSACFYVTQHKYMLSHMDAGTSIENTIQVSRDVNGNVSIENLNGLEIRLQSVVYLKNILFDDIIQPNDTNINFTWRRSTRKEVVLDTHGQPVMSGTPPKPKRAYRTEQHSINVSLEKQKSPAT